MGFPQKQHNHVSAVCMAIEFSISEHISTTKWSQFEQSGGHKQDQYLTFMNPTNSDGVLALCVLDMLDLMM